MVFNPATDFLALWRNIAGVVSKEEIPGLDYMVAALARAGVITLSVSATAPVANQSTTAWLATAVPSYSAEGALNLWDKVTSAYLPATPALFLQLLEASAGESGASWWTTTGLPSNVVGNNGDFIVRLDAPNGIYGPKALGAWPVDPIPGTADVLTDTTFDNTFGEAPGQIIYRGASVWQALPVGAADTVLTSLGGLPAWDGLSALMDVVFGSAWGDTLFRGSGTWEALPPGTAGQILATNGAGQNPSWQPRTAEFPSGTIMVFKQTAAPPGWTKQTALNDYGLRVTSGTVGTTAGTAFSTVFAQTVVGNTTLSTPQMPSHSHAFSGASPTSGTNSSAPDAGSTYPVVGGSISIGSTGGGGSHTHSVNLTLAYTDVIIASKN